MTTLEMREPETRVPAPPAILGALGALTFAGLLLAQVESFEPFGRPPTGVLALFSAVVLSFLGAVHWGLAMAEYGGRRDTTWSYIVSILPAFLGWFSVAFLPIRVALGVIALGFVLLLLYDLRSLRLGRVPSWYGRLRWPLTVVVVPCLALAAILS
jgi:Protein of unknown function (DUF3429)